MFELHPEFSRALMEAMPGGLAFVDRAGNLQWANESFGRLLGTDRSDLLGRPARTLAFLVDPVPATGERFSSFGDLMVIERVLLLEPLVGRLIQLLPRKPLQAALPMPVRLTLPDLPSPSGILSKETGLHRLAIEISRSRRYENPLSCVVARVEGGDLAQGLEILIGLLKEQLRWVDVLIQWNAEQVIVLLPETNAEAAGQLQKKLAARVVTKWPAHVANTQLCWGNSSWRKGDDADRLIHRAESSALTQPTD